ncbi:protease inhibitor I42 family protein [Chloroflexota bacterium]
MRYKTLITLLSVILLAVYLPGCGNGSQEASIEVTCDEFREQPDAVREIEVSEGSTFTVTLCTSATAGFLWSDEVEISNDSAVMFVEHDMKTAIVDTASREMWTFQALATGNSTIGLLYSRPWAIDDGQDMWTLSLFVIVK